MNGRLPIRSASAPAIGETTPGAAVATSDLSYVQLGPAFAIAGVGIGMVFPTVANAVLGSVPPASA